MDNNNDRHLLPVKPQFSGFFSLETLKRLTADFDVILLRGLPGGGKSTLADDLKTLFCVRGYLSTVISTDHYHVDDDGVYRFKADRIGEFHTRAKRAYLERLLNSGVPVIVDNTNTSELEICYYYELAEVLKRRVVIVEIRTVDTEAAFLRNTHNVPRHVFDRMVECLSYRLPPWWAVFPILPVGSSSEK